MILTLSIIIPIRIEHKNFMPYFENLRHSLHSAYRTHIKNDTIEIKKEIIVVDFGSGSDWARRIKKLCIQYSACKYLRGESSLWSRSRAINLGIKASMGEYVCIIDADVIVQKSYLLDHITAQRDNNVMFTLCEVYDAPQGSEYLSDVSIYSKYKMNIRRGGWGHILIKRTLLDSINLYDEEYIYWGAEDNDLVMRLRKKGYTYKVLSIHPIHLWHPAYRVLMSSIGKGKIAHTHRIKNRTRYFNKRDGKI